MFGIELIDASLAPALLIAVAAGALSFLSPCVLPIVPPYLAYIGGVSFGELKSARSGSGVTASAASFVLGLSTVFILLGLAASAAGTLFLEHQRLLGRLAGAVILLFGLHFLGVLRIPLLDREGRFESRHRGGALGAFVLGLAFAFGWAPCIGPQLGAILALASQEESIARGTALLAAYAAGLGIPFLLAAAFIDRSLGVMERLKPHLRTIEICIGALLCVVGLLLITDRFSAIAYWLLETLPFLAEFG